MIKLLDINYFHMFQIPWTKWEVRKKLKRNAFALKTSHSPQNTEVSIM